MEMIVKSQDPLESELYPDSDGMPMAEKTLQYEWIVTIKGNLDALFRNDPNVFVAGDLLWYAVEGNPEIRTAPDSMVVFGRPKGHRGSYKQWREEEIAPQVVFEILSPGNRDREMEEKFAFYEDHGVEEYYLYYPDEAELRGWRRVEGRLEAIPQMHHWVSPRLGIRFDISESELRIFGPDGRRFLTFQELVERQERDSQRAELAESQAREAQRYAAEAQQKAQLAQQQNEEARQQALLQKQRAERLAAQLRALGVDPEG